MVAITFQPQFAPEVEDGTKLQTIRQNARCKPGDALQLYTGMRTKACRKLRDAVCRDVMAVVIHEARVDVDGALLDGIAAELFARKDGFASFTDMAAWFRKRYGVLPFTGYCIRWR